MLSELIPIPKTRAGQYIKGDDVTVIKERLTSYGSMAIIKSDNCYLVIYWDSDTTTFIFSDCGHNTRFLNTLWEEII